MHCLAKITHYLGFCFLLFFQGYFTIDSRRLASMHRKSNARNNKLLYGVKQFNLDPKKGLSVLQESGFLPSPATVEKVGDSPPLDTFFHFAAYSY